MAVPVSPYLSFVSRLQQAAYICEALFLSLCASSNIATCHLIFDMSIKLILQASTFH